LDARDIVIVAVFAFLKSAVMDWSTEDERQPCISRAQCTAFRRSLVLPSSSEAALPDGFQVWIAQYRRTRVMETYAHIDELSPVGIYAGFRILVITYVVGSFVFQATFPRWTRKRQYRELPILTRINDLYSIPIWPGIGVAHWPPPRHIDRSSLDDFRERFRRVLVRRTSG
jgi:hypothetical protein